MLREGWGRLYPLERLERVRWWGMAPRLLVQGRGPLGRLREGWGGQWADLGGRWGYQWGARGRLCRWEDQWGARGRLCRWEDQGAQKGVQWVARSQDQWGWEGCWDQRG